MYNPDRSPIIVVPALLVVSLVLGEESKTMQHPPQDQNVICQDHISDLLLLWFDLVELGRYVYSQ
jgi:hypothetical protein